MSPNQVYATVPTPDQMCGDIVNGVVGTDWYTPSTFPFDQNNYLTPFPTSTIETSPWPLYRQAPIPHGTVPSNAEQVQSGYYQQQAHSSNAPGRPRSSPSTFGPSPDHIAWSPSSTGLGIEYTNAATMPTPVTSTFPPSVFQYPNESPEYTTSSPPELQQPQPCRPYASIAPSPSTLNATTLNINNKRSFNPDDTSGPTTPDALPTSSKRRKRTSSVASSADMSEDDRFLLQLKETESLPWKEIASRFHTDRGKPFQVAALQMRYKRLREKFRVWEERDARALKMAHEYWEKFKWDIIGTKMLDFGLTERWPARSCARKWQELEYLAPSAVRPMTTAQYSSTVDAPVHFAYAWQPLP
nr:hypothetical protein B0A51_05187 [Rachicladosporium sp. CCFEE 5018]